MFFLLLWLLSAFSSCWASLQPPWQLFVIYFSLYQVIIMRAEILFQNISLTDYTLSELLYWFLSSYLHIGHIGLHWASATPSSRHTASVEHIEFHRCRWCNGGAERHRETAFSDTGLSHVRLHLYSQPHQDRLLWWRFPQPELNFLLSQAFLYF